MKESRKNIRLTTLHFCILFVLFALSISIKVQADFRKEEKEFLSSVTEPIPEIAHPGIISDEISFVLFYDEESPSVRKMEKNLSRLSGNEGIEAAFYKVNGLQQESLSLEYAISGFPTVLIVKNGEEFNRILGVTSYSNLKHIYGKVR